MALGLGLACAEPSAPAADPTPAAASPKPEPATVKPPAAKPEPAPAGPGVRPDGEVISAVEWFEGSLEQALVKAKAEGKLVFLDVGAYWCPPCHRLDEEVFVRPEVGEALAEGYVALHVDAEKGEGSELVERYHVQAFPTLLVLEASGVEKGRVVDFIEPAALLSALEQVARGHNVLAELVDEVEANPDDLALRYKLGHAYLLAADAERAKGELDAVMLGDPKNELGLAGKVLYDRALFVTYKLERDPEGAIAEFRRLQDRFPDSKEAVRAYRHIGRMLAKLGREDEAIQSLEAMMTQDPSSASLASSYGWFSFRHKCGPEHGLAAVDRGLRQEPDNADLHYLRAELLHLVGKDAQGLAAIKQASALEPKTAFYRRQVRRFEALAGASG